nr:Mannosylglycerate hydrolase [Cryobacterium sp. SO1]
MLWDADASSVQLRAYVDAEKVRLPDGPWLLLNGGDHLVPQPPSTREQHSAEARVDLIESTLADFFAAARESGASLPVIDGELRRPGNRLTFLLPGTLSARTYVKLANEHVQTLLERFVEPQLARLELRSGPSTIPVSDSRSLSGLLDHAWDLVIKNSPHDSICGCSVDEVHRTTTVRAERAVETGELLVQRMLLEEGLDTRRYGTPPTEKVDLVVLSGLGAVVSGPVVVEVATDVGSSVTALVTPDGHEIPFEIESTRLETVFEADLDLLPDSRQCAIHRIAFTATDVPAFGWKAYTARLGGAVVARAQEVETGQPIVSGRFSITVNPDASVRVQDRDTGVVHDHIGRLVSTGDRGDSYNYDPPANDSAVEPRVTGVRVTETPVRTRLEITASLLLPAALTADRDSRSAECVSVPLTISIEHWRDRDQLDWAVSIDNKADDHRLRFEVPVDSTATQWTADQHWSALTRPIGPELGELPTGPALEAASGVAPVHSWASVGTGANAVALLTRGLPEIQAYTAGGASVLAVTVLRAVGWMSRFDLRTRTTGAGPMLPVPEAQCHGVLTAHLSIIFGTRAEAGSLHLPAAAALRRVPLQAFPLRPGHPAPSAQSEPGDAPQVIGALVSTWKPVDQTTGGGGSVLRISNPTPQAVTASVHLPTRVGTVERARIDETVLATLPIAHGNRLTVELGPFGLETLILRAGER